MKASSCFKCRHYFPTTDWDGRSPCNIGHRPRYYKSKGLRAEFANPEHWGYKRICTDYLERPKFIVEYGYVHR